MLKELNQTFGAVCSATASTAKAVENGSKILLIKGEAAKQVAAIESVKAIAAAKEGCTEEEIAAAIELLSIVD